MVKIVPMEIRNTLVDALEDILGSPPHIQFSLRVRTEGTALNLFTRAFMDHAVDKLCVYLSDLNIEDQARETGE